MSERLRGYLDRRREQRRLRPAVAAFDQFPAGFTPADEARLAPIESNFACSFHDTLRAMAPFLPGSAVRLKASGRKAQYYASDAQEALYVDSSDFGINYNGPTAENVFPELIGKYDINFLKSTGRGRVIPVAKYTTNDVRLNYAPQRLNQRIAFVTQTLAPFLDQDVYVYSDYISAIGAMRRNALDYKATVEDISAGNAKTIQDATGDLIHKLTSAGSQEAMPRTVALPLRGASFSLDTRTTQLRRYSSDETVPAREATPVEWCSLAQYMKYRIVYEYITDSLPNEHLRQFKGASKSEDMRDQLLIQVL